MRGKLWCLDDSVRTSPKLVGSRAAEVSIYQKRSKEGTVVNQRQGQSLVLMHVGSEASLCGPIQQMLLVLIEKCQCITICYVLGCIAAGESGCPCWWLWSIPESANMGTWSSERNHGAIEEGGLVWWTPFVCFFGGFLASCGWMFVCVSLTWGTPVHCA